MIVIKNPKSLESAIRKYNLAMKGFVIDLGMGVTERNKPAFNAKTPVEMYFVRGTCAISKERPSQRTLRNERFARMTMENVLKVPNIRMHPMIPQGHKEKFQYMKQLSKTPGSSFYTPWRDR